MSDLLSFISPEGVIYITPERMLGGDDNDGMPLKEATIACTLPSYIFT